MATPASRAMHALSKPHVPLVLLAALLPHLAGAALVPATMDAVLVSAAAPAGDLSKVKYSNICLQAKRSTCRPRSVLQWPNRGNRQFGKVDFETWFPTPQIAL